MAHNTRAQPDAAWVTGFTVPLATHEAFDARVASTIDGDNGGCCAPATPIVIGGLGLTLTGPLVIWGNVAAIQVASQGTPWPGALRTQTGSRIILEDNDFPQLAPGHVGRTRHLVVECVRGRSFPWRATQPSMAFPGAIQVTSAGALRLGVLVPTTIYVPLWQGTHNGATLTQATFSWRVAFQHDTVPTLPKFRVLAVDVSGNVTPMTSAAAGADANGYMSPPTPSSGAAWYAGGLPQTFVLPIDTGPAGSGNVIDTSQYSYFAQIVEEVDDVNGTEVVGAALCATTGANITLSGTQTIDGVAVVAGNRVLVKDQTNPQQNGTYLVAAGLWTRADIFGGFAASGAVVPVLSGLQNGGTSWVLTMTGTTVNDFPVWEASTGYGPGAIVVPTTGENGLYFINAGGVGSSDPATEPTWPTRPGQTVVDNTVTWMAVTDSTTAKLQFAPGGDAAANIYHSVALDLSNIVDARWQ